MEDHRTVSVSKTYVPNEYAVYLSPEDHARFADYEDALVSELAGYLLEHARSEKLALLSRPTVEFRTDERLSLGEFGIQARLVRPPAGAAAPPAPARAGAAGASRPRPYPPRARGRGRQAHGGGTGRRRLGPQPRLRHRPQRRQRVAAPRGDSPGGRRLDDRRPRIHQRRGRQRPECPRRGGALGGRPGRAGDVQAAVRAGVGRVQLEPVSVVLKFGFLIVLYLFLLWVARSALKDLRRGSARADDPMEATGLYAASAGLAHPAIDGTEPRLRVEQAAGLRGGDE